LTPKRPSKHRRSHTGARQPPSPTSRAAASVRSNRRAIGAGATVAMRLRRQTCPAKSSRCHAFPHSFFGTAHGSPRSPWPMFIWLNQPQSFNPHAEAVVLSRQNQACRCWRSKAKRRHSPSRRAPIDARSVTPVVCGFAARLREACRTPAPSNFPGSARDGFRPELRSWASADPACPAKASYSFSPRAAGLHGPLGRARSGRPEGGRIDGCRRGASASQQRAIVLQRCGHLVVEAIGYCRSVPLVPKEFARLSISQSGPAMVVDQKRAS